MPVIIEDRRDLPTNSWISLTEIVSLLIYGAPLDAGFSIKNAVSEAERLVAWRAAGGAANLVAQLEILTGEKKRLAPFDEYDKKHQAILLLKVQSWLTQVAMSPDEALRTVRLERHKHDMGKLATTVIVRNAYLHLNAFLTSGEITLFGNRKDIHEEIPIAYFAADRWHDLLENNMCGGVNVAPDSIERRMLSYANERPGGYSDLKVMRADSNRVVQEWRASNADGPRRGKDDARLPVPANSIQVSSPSSSTPRKKGRIGRAEQIRAASKIAFPPNGVWPDWMEPGDRRNKISEVIVKQFRATAPDRKTYAKEGF